MYCSTDPRAAHCSLLLASGSLVALAMSAGIATAGDDGRFFDRDSLKQQHLRSNKGRCRLANGRDAAT
jgi:hypothetical protein